MPNRQPSNRRRTSVSRKKKEDQLPLSPNSRKKCNEWSKICMRKLRKNWNSEQKLQKDTKMRQRKRRENDVRVRKPYQKVRENLKNKTAEEVKKIRAAQKKLQRQYHAVKAKTTVEFETFVVEQEEEQGQEQSQEQEQEQEQGQGQEQVEDEVDEQLKLNCSARMKKSLSLESAVASFLKYEKGKSKQQRVMLETIRKETEGSSDAKNWFFANI